jgi:hypothetical protein
VTVLPLDWRHEYKPSPFSGLCVQVVQVQTAETYLNPEPSQKALGYELDDLGESFRETMAVCKVEKKISFEEMLAK